ANIRYGVAQAKAYDDATSAYPGFVASRRNYDVGQGIDGRGRWRSGVFEASWRVGGASSAEVEALAVFTDDGAGDAVGASSVQAFGKDLESPPGAHVHFHGNDPRRGPMIAYSRVTRVLRQTT